MKITITILVSITFAFCSTADAAWPWCRLFAQKSAQNETAPKTSNAQPAAEGSPPVFSAEDAGIKLPFSPKEDALIVTFDAGNERADQTMVAMRAGGKFEPVLEFPAAEARSYSMGRPTPPPRAERNPGAPREESAPAALIDVKDLPADYAAQRLKPQPSEPRKPSDDPMGSLSRGQLTWKRSPDGLSIIVYNGVWDANGTFVPAKNPIKVASREPASWSRVAEIPAKFSPTGTPDQSAIELLPRAEPYYLRLPNGGVLTVKVTPRKGNAAPVSSPTVASLPPADPKPIEQNLRAALGGNLNEGELVTLRSKPRLPDHPEGNHYIGHYAGTVVQDGQVYLKLTDRKGRPHLYLADRVDFSAAKKGIDSALIGPGPGNLLAKPKPAPVNPRVDRFDPKGDVDAQMNKYLGSFTHPVKGPAGWLEFAEGQRGIGLGGNLEGARVIQMPNGATAVAKTYVESAAFPRSIESVISGIHRMEVWASEGRGPKVYGVGYKVEGGRPPRVRITVIMENMLPEKRSAQDASIEGAQGYWISQEARELPAAARTWLRDMLLLTSSPTNHPDGHLLNVGYRIKHIRSDADLPAHGNYYRVGNQVVEVYAVDSAGALADQTMMAGEYMKQYDPARKREYLDRELSLRD